MGPGFVDHIMSIPQVVKVLKNTEQGAATTVYAAMSKEWEARGGKYLEDCDEAPRGKDDTDTFGVGFVKQTYDPDDEARLWKGSLKMVGIKDDL
jgi:hypothetical protein